MRGHFQNQRKLSDCRLISHVVSPTAAITFVSYYVYVGHLFSTLYSSVSLANLSRFYRCRRTATRQICRSSWMRSNNKLPTGTTLDQLHLIPLGAHCPMAVPSLYAVFTLCCIFIYCPMAHLPWGSLGLSPWLSM